MSQRAYEEWRKFYETAADRVRAVYVPESWRYPYYTADIGGGLSDASLRREWLLSNGIGGYASSTISGLNTRREHGLLVSASRNLALRLLLSDFDENVASGGSHRALRSRSTVGRLEAPGMESLKTFRLNLDSVSWQYDLGFVTVEKTIEIVPGRNAVLASYSITNSGDSDVMFESRPAAASRGVNGQAGGNSGFASKLFSGHAAGVSSDGGYLVLYSEKMECRLLEDKLIEGVSYPNEAGMPPERFYAPVVFTLPVGAHSIKTAGILAVGYPTEEETARNFKELAAPGGFKRRHKLLSSGLGDDLIAFSAACDSFIVDYIGKKTILAGYPNLGQRGRDAMLALSGLVLSAGRFDIAESIFENFMGRMHEGRIPSRIVDGVPEYEDFDASLWLIDRLGEYRRRAGDDRFRHFILKHWDAMADALQHYRKFEKEGLLQNDGGTWMGSAKRPGAVEIQALWYNALKNLKDFSLLAGEKMDVAGLIRKYEKNFMTKYWNGEYLNDSESDRELRPSQLIAISLDYTAVGPKEAAGILRHVENGLYTMAGMRTLTPKSSKYRPTAEDENGLYNGGILPHLAGPYFKACMRIDGLGYRQRAIDFFTEFLRLHLRDKGIGLICEAYDGNEPHTPRGCISHAVNTAELMRIYRDATSLHGY